jgi:hypothetical protein
MRNVKAALCGLVFAFVFLSGQAWGDPPVRCPDVLLPGGECAADLQAAIDACCPCDDAQFSSHGRYVRCVAHATNALRRAGCLDRGAHKALRRCAARSTCNKPEGFVTCCRARSGVCRGNGVCAGTRGEGAVACETDDQCPPRVRCSVKSDEQRCLDKGGTPGTGSCCGAVCPAPPSEPSPDSASTD